MSHVFFLGSHKGLCICEQLICSDFHFMLMRSILCQRHVNGIASGRFYAWVQVLPKGHMKIFFGQMFPTVSRSGLANLLVWYNVGDTASSRCWLSHRSPKSSCSCLKDVPTCRNLKRVTQMTEMPPGKKCSRLE